MRVNIHKGLIYKYTQHRLEQYIKADMTFDVMLQDEKHNFVKMFLKRHVLFWYF